jgi:hypothetical protein
LVIRSSCNTVGTALVLGLVAGALLACQGEASLGVELQQEETGAELEPTESVEPNQSSTPPGSESTLTSSNPLTPQSTPPESNPAPVGISEPNTDPVITPPPPAPEGSCWQLPVITRARLLAAPGRAAALVGGKIMGSNRSAMNDFVDLGVVTSAAEGAWVELTFSTPAAYRYVKFYGAPTTYGALAEVEFYAGDVRLSGEQFGTTGSRDDSGNTFDHALDGNPTTFFESPLPNDGYVGLDVAQGHIATAPAISPPGGDFRTAPTVTLQAEAGASLLFTLDGSDPQVNGTPYTGPLTLPARTTLLRTVARRDCTLPSETAQAVFRMPDTSVPGSPPPPVQSSIHIGNSLTDTIVDYMEPLAQSGGVQLDFNRYTIPGAGTYLYVDNPTGGFGVDNVQTTLQTRAFDHLSMQPFPSWPCQLRASTSGNDPGTDSDSGYISRAWGDALSQNPNVQLWVYQQWPDPLDVTNCITGSPTYSRGDWDPGVPADWNEAVMHELAYDEELVDELISLEPGAPRPYIVPGGLALVNLKAAIEAGRLPGYSDFFGQIFQAGGTDIHLTRPGAYFISLVFYSVMFQSSPVNTYVDPDTQLTDQQALVLQSIAWETVTGYASSGVTR